VLLDKEKKLREVFLFSDCILWLVPPNTELPQPSQPAPQSSTRPRLGLRTRSRSDASLPRLSLQSTKSSPSLSSGKEYAFDRHFNLIDTEVVIGPSHPKVQEFGFDILSPDGSFSLFCGKSPRLWRAYTYLVHVADGTSLEDWVSSIRAAKASLLIGLSSIQMNTTLTSSSSNAHVRRALRALPYASEADPGSVRRGKVEHFLPPVWVPDQRTQHCMRCSKAFTWRRRRHHCRLCGRCVCAACSAKVGGMTVSRSITEPHCRHSSLPKQQAKKGVKLPALAICATTQSSRNSSLMNQMRPSLDLDLKD
jgi:FYVE, RhoGEF and PH domain containing 5/6